MITMIDENYVKCEMNNIVQQYKYKDKDEIQWEIYLSDKKTFLICNDKKNRKEYFHVDDMRTRIINNGIFYIDDMNFNIFYYIRDIIINNYTDEIWNIVEKIFKNGYNNGNMK
jgi:hypothetical protein